MKIAGKIQIFIMLTIILLVIGLFISGQAFALTKTADFEGGTVGAIANSATCWDYAGSRTTISSDRAHSGTKSTKMEWRAGDEGFGTNHGNINIPAVGNGGEIWARGYFYFASPWTWQSLGGGYKAIKVLRMVTSAGGMDSIFTDTNGSIVLSNEPAQVQTVSSAKLDIGRWQCLEIYVKASSTSSGIIRIWKDGILVAESTGKYTLANSYNVINSIQVMSQWNQSPAQNQTQYLDNFIATTDTPSQRDNNGNPMIGPINGTNPVKLAPPTGLRLTAN